MTNNEITKAYLGSEEVTKIYQGNTVIYEKETDYSKMPLTFEITGDGYINWTKNNDAAPTVTIEYRVNNGEWISVTNTSTTGYSFNVVSGDTVEFRGTNTTYGNTYYNTFSGSTCQFNVYGNIMSMIDATDFENLTSFSTNNVLKYIFRETNAISAKNLILPATTLTELCYAGLFRSCPVLVTAPELPATTLATGCYSAMFNGCTNLVNAPELLATTLARSCYAQMFEGCTSLVNAPVLPATTLTNNCYQNMFYGCTSLNYIKCLATNISASYCINLWVTNVAASGTFVTPSTTNWTTGDSGIPSGWTRVDV